MNRPAGSPRVLVTGAGGFVGRHCLSALVERGVPVHAVGRSGLFEKLPGIVGHRADLLASPLAMEGILRHVRPTHLLHLAWVTDHGSFWHLPANADWLAASLRLVQQFLHHGGRRVVTVGSAAEYVASGAPCHEQSTICAPATLYGACKHALNLGTSRLVGENATHAHARLFQVFGPGEDSRRLVPAVLHHLRGGTPLPCTAGEQLRDFVFVEHVAQALVALVLGKVVGAVNIASGKPTTVRNFATRLATVAGADAKLLQFGALPTPAHEQPVLTARVERLRNELLISETAAVEYGIRKTVEAEYYPQPNIVCPTTPVAPCAATTKLS